MSLNSCSWHTILCFTLPLISKEPELYQWNTSKICHSSLRELPTELSSSLQVNITQLIYYQQHNTERAAQNTTFKYIWQSWPKRRNNKFEASEALRNNSLLMCHYSCRILLGQHLNYKTHVGHAHSLKATQQNCLWPERRNWRKENRPKNEGRVAGGCPCRGHQGWEEWVTTATSPVCSFTTSWRALWGHRQHLSLHLR